MVSNRIKYTLTMTIMAIIVAGCDSIINNSTTGDTSDNSISDSNVSTVDNSIRDNNGTTVTYENDGTGYNEDGSVADPYFGEVPYDANFTQEECTEAGYFYCTIDDKCLDLPLDGSSCS